MNLTYSQAAEIAALLNARNQLTVTYSAESVLTHAASYLYRVSSAGNVVACLEIKRVQWYQAEVLHLTVAAAEVGKGHAKALLLSAETRARDSGARLLQCTIREGNKESAGLFQSAGFFKVSSFHNSVSGNNVDVFQKVLVPAH